MGGTKAGFGNPVCVDLLASCVEGDETPRRGVAIRKFRLPGFGRPIKGHRRGGESQERCPDLFHSEPVANRANTPRAMPRGRKVVGGEVKANEASTPVREAL